MLLELSKRYLEHLILNSTNFEPIHLLLWTIVTCVTFSSCFLVVSQAWHRHEVSIVCDGDPQYTHLGT